MFIIIFFRGGSMPPNFPFILTFPWGLWMTPLAISTLCRAFLKQLSNVAAVNAFIYTGSVWLYMDSPVVVSFQGCVNAGSLPSPSTNVDRPSEAQCIHFTSAGSCSLLMAGSSFFFMPFIKQGHSTCLGKQLFIWYRWDLVSLLKVQIIHQFYSLIL